MTRTSLLRSALALVTAVVLPMSVATAQTDSAAARSRAGMYDATQHVAFTGVTVVRVDTVKAASGTGSSLSAVFAAGNDSLTAWLAPAEFLTANSVTLAAGDVIDISGSKVMMEGKPALIASEIKKGEAKVVLRDKATGAPAWPQGTARP
ncbi:MAG: hypothetical protein IT355_02590 [Gemmatimonadaceae bacterium]|nr:hypothetical protein [Gemmatimonadaceae bacterium]